MRQSLAPPQGLCTGDCFLSLCQLVTHPSLWKASHQCHYLKQTSSPLLPRPTPPQPSSPLPPSIPHCPVWSPPATSLPHCPRLSLFLAAALMFYLQRLTTGSTRGMLGRWGPGQAGPQSVSSHHMPTRLPTAPKARAAMPLWMQPGVMQAWCRGRGWVEA